MPRTTKVESPGCPPLRALATDALGLIKVVEAHEKVGIPKVVNVWGSPDVSRAVITTSFIDRPKNPLLAVARKNGVVELLNPMNGDAFATTKVSEIGLSNHSAEEDPVIGLHCFRTENNELYIGSSMLLICTEKGKACLMSIPTKDDVSTDASAVQSLKNWDATTAGKIICSSVDSKGNYALFGGKGIELNVWDLKTYSRIWTSKLPRANSLGIFSPTYFTASTFLDKEDHRKIVAGTNSYQIRLYDISAQRRPVLSVDFRESPIKVVTEDLNGHIVYVGTGIGDLASFDTRTGKLLGCFTGKCSGSIRSIAKHSELPLLASCGLDSYLRIWDSGTRQLLSAVFLKQHLTNVVFDSHFSSEFPASDAAEKLHDLHADDHGIEKSAIEKMKFVNCKRELGNINQVVESVELSTSDEEIDKKKPLKRKDLSKDRKGNVLERMKRKRSTGSVD